jgi:hypothetical protein
LPLIVLAVAGNVAIGGACFLGGYTVGYLQHKPATAAARPTPTPTPTTTPTTTPTPTPSPTPSATVTPVECWFGDFPQYPGSRAVTVSTQGAEAWHVDTIPSKVDDYFASGAGQQAWQFRLTSASASAWIFRMIRAPSCRGSLTVKTDPAGGTFYQAIPDRQ